MARLTLAVLITVMAALFLVGNSDTESVAGATKMSKKEMEKIVKQKTEEAIKKLEKQFKATFMAFNSANETERKLMAKEKLDDLVNEAKRTLEENLEKTVQRFKLDNERLSEKETRKALESLVKRSRRSASWGSCRPLCQHRCLPNCNLVCCIAPPYNVSQKFVQRLERKWVKKHRLRHVNKKSEITKAEMDKGDICGPQCLKACLPKCKFRCCIASNKKKARKHR